MLKKVFVLFICLWANHLYGQKGAPYDIKDAGADYKKKCESCLKMIESKPQEVGFSVKDDGEYIYFLTNDHEWLFQLLDGNNDGIAIDIVTKNQFKCGSKNSYNENALYKGYLLPPLYKKDLEKLGEIHDRGYYKVAVGKLPPQFRNRQVEYNILFLDNKYNCYYQSFYNIEGTKWELLETGLFVDTLQNLSDIDKSIILNKRFKFEIPFEKNKYDYQESDIRPVYDSLQLYNYDIKSLTIEAYTSVEGSKEINEELQEKRANSIVKALESFQQHDIEKEIITAENWVDFFNDIKGTPFDQWGRWNKSKIKQELVNDNLDRMEPILSNHRKAILYLSLEKKVDYHFTSEEEVVKLFDEAVAKEDVQAALDIQKAAYYHVQNELLPETLIDKLEIPQTSIFGPVYNNSVVYKYTYAPQKINHAIAEFKKLHELLPDNPRVLYNLVSLQLKALSYNDPLVDQKQVLSSIKELEDTDLDESLTDRLNINYGIIRSEQLELQKKYKERTEMVKSIYYIYSSTDLSAEDALSLAKYFVSYYQYAWAMSLLEPYIQQIDTSEDLLFYYINLTIIHDDMVKSESYRSLLINAANKDKDRFCKLFDSSIDGGITFQLLTKKRLKDQYCDSCAE